MSKITIENPSDFQSCPKPFNCLPASAALAVLQAKPNWVCWTYETRQQRSVDGGKALTPQVTKPPINPKTGQKASVSDPGTWGTYEEAAAHALQHALPGVGIVLTPDDGLIGIDLDDCLESDGEPQAWVKEVLGFGETYAEVSPSGTGIRMFAQGHQDKAVKSAVAGVEVYGNARYLTVTGNQVPGTPDHIAPAPRTLAALVDRVASKAVILRQAAVADASCKPKVALSAGDFWRNVNDLALENLPLWVPEIFPEATFASSHQGYRIASVDLGRDLQEDLCIHPMGIVDFGVADQGDSNQGRRTAIDLVIEYASRIDLEVSYTSEADNGRNAWLAARWLCNRLSQSIWKLGREPSSEEEWLDFFNEQYCVVHDGGRTSVLGMKVTTAFSVKRNQLEFFSFQSFKDLYINRTVSVTKSRVDTRNNRNKSVSSDTDVAAGEWWLKHLNRRQYINGIVFAPKQPKEFDNQLNLWSGFGITPKQGDWSLMQAHINTVLANGNEEYNDYILKWCAFAVQFPERRAEVAIVFKGKQGTGKSTICNVMLDIFAQHAIKISSAEQMMGKFNSHFRDTVLLVADEAYWPGNKSFLGPLKRMITEETLFIEAKSKDGTSCTNYIHMMMTSNEQWVVPADENERRFAIFDVSDCYIQNGDWFELLYKQVKCGGREAMLYDLMQMDLTGWHPRNIPVTEALLEQQEIGMSPIDSWFKEVLNEGIIPGSHSKNANLSHGASLLQSLKESHSSLKDFSSKSLGMYLKDRGCDNKIRVNGLRWWTFPALDQLRKEWEQRYKGTTWENPDVTEWCAQLESPTTQPLATSQIAPRALRSA